MDDSALPVPVTAYGPLISYSFRVHRLSHSGHCHEALAAADAYEHLARLAGDEKTVGFLIQGRMYAYTLLGRHREAAHTGEELLRRHRAAGFTLGEAKTLCDLAGQYVMTGQLVESMRCLARAGLLLDGCPPRGDRYEAALASLAEAARVAGLYEIAAQAYERLLAIMASSGSDLNKPVELAYASTLLVWGLCLDQLGQGREAAWRLRRCAEIADRWAANLIGPGTARPALAIRAVLALALAKLGEFDRAADLAAGVIMPLRAQEQHWGARLAHLALGLSLRGRGDLAGARREFVAARELCAEGASPDEQLIVRGELAALAAQVHGPEASRDFLDTIGELTRQVWDLRRQRLAMLRQARQREELETVRASAEFEMMHDALTGLGNRRRFDQIVTEIDTGERGGPLVLLLIDVDKFKAINDTFSHSAGDRVLREIATIIRAYCRAEMDEPVRYAGDEFTVFLDTDQLAGIEVAERIRAAVASTDFGAIAPGLTVSISTGLAALLPGMTGADLFHAADQRLYEAKRHGRDRVAV